MSGNLIFYIPRNIEHDISDQILHIAGTPHPPPPKLTLIGRLTYGWHRYKLKDKSGGYTSFVDTTPPWLDWKNSTADAARSGDTAGMVPTIATHVVRMALVQIAISDPPSPTPPSPTPPTDENP